MADRDVAVPDNQALDNHLLARIVAFLFFLRTFARGFFDVLADHVDIAATVAEFIGDFRFVDDDRLDDDCIAGQAGGIEFHRDTTKLEG